jgi:excinuclease ABC subunit B
MVILYADIETPSMRQAIEETGRRRQIQSDFNTANGIVPYSVQKEILTVFDLSQIDEVLTPP